MRRHERNRFHVEERRRRDADQNDFSRNVSAVRRRPGRRGRNRSDTDSRWGSRVVGVVDQYFLRPSRPARGSCFSPRQGDRRQRSGCLDSSPLFDPASAMRSGARRVTPSSRVPSSRNRRPMLRLIGIGSNRVLPQNSASLVAASTVLKKKADTTRPVSRAAAARAASPILSSSAASVKSVSKATTLGALSTKLRTSVA